MYSEHKHNLFTDFGCLNQDTLKRMTSGDLSEDESHLVQAHIDTCPFCADAQEGISQIDAEGFDRNLFSIRFQLRQRNFNKRAYKKPVVAVFNQPKVLIYLSIAICFVLILYFMPFYLAKEQKQKHLIHQRHISDSLASVSLNKELSAILLNQTIQSLDDTPIYFQAILLPEGQLWNLESSSHNKQIENWLIDQEIKLDTKGIRFSVDIVIEIKHKKVTSVKLSIRK